MGYVAPVNIVSGHWSPLVSLCIYVCLYLFVCMSFTNSILHDKTWESFCRILNNIRQPDLQNN